MSSTANAAGQNALAWAKLKMEFLKLLQLTAKPEGTPDVGQTLDEAILHEMEHALGNNLRDVRIHMTKQAGELAQRLDADAFTIGIDIFAAEGKLNPTTKEGRGLLVHELTHVAQHIHPQPLDLPHIPTPQFAQRPSSSTGDSTQAAATETEAVNAEQASNRTMEGANDKQAPVIDTHELADYVYRLMQQELLLEKDRTRR